MVENGVRHTNKNFEILELIIQLLFYTLPCIRQDGKGN